MTLIPRTAAASLRRLARGFPIVAITGPRQAGKTTLARLVFPQKPYVTLEDPEEREFATGDPRRFLARFAEGAILDEVQRVPDLLSYLQGEVDRRGPRQPLVNFFTRYAILAVGAYVIMARLRLPPNIGR